MNVHAPPQSSGYSIDIQSLEGQVTAYRNGRVLASSRAAKVMHETRLPSVVYFPIADVEAALSDKTDLQTFCPFKGTASYRDVTLEGETLENAAWSYDAALPESHGIEGHIGFLSDAVTEFDLGENALPANQHGNVSGPLVDWLLREAALLSGPEDFTKALTQKLRENGVALSRMSVLIWSLHPMIAGKHYVWNIEADELATYAPSYEIHDHPAFMNSPLRHVSNGLGGIRQKLDEPNCEVSFPIMDDLRAQGATDYVAMPLPFSDGRTNVLTLTSDHPDGFTTANLGLIFECSAVISRFYEVFMQRENAQSLLETYVGKRSGARVLGGEIRRGDGDEIDAAIMFCDMRDSTRLEETLPRDDYISLLNQFFDTTSNIVHKNGGEVLKFIGDAVLAVFPVDDDAKKACLQALRSARAIVSALGEDGDQTFDCAIGMAFGQVTYGNVGSKERLDFTVIGQAANVAARLCDYGKICDRRVVATKDVICDDPGVTELGLIELRNVSEPIHGYAIEESVAS